MTAEHRASALTYFQLIYEWHQKRQEVIERGEYEQRREEIRSSYPDRSKGILGYVIADLICWIFNEYYFGPLTLPEAVADLWMGESYGEFSPSNECEVCGYWQLRLQHRNCLLCGGKAGWRCYVIKRNLFRQDPYKYRDEKNNPILSPGDVSYMLGVICNFGSFDSFRVQEAATTIN